MKYDRLEFLEFFDNEIIPHTQDKNLEVHYTLTSNLLKIILVLKPLNKYVAIIVEHTQLKHNILEIAFDNIINVSCNKEFLYFYKDNKPLSLDKNSMLKIRIRPNFYCSFDISSKGISQDN
jgi:hypothetical protein